MSKKTVSPGQSRELIGSLKARFENHMKRHQGLKWEQVEAPPGIRKLGGALFCDRRYDTVFVYHDGAESYYAARGFRSSLRV